MPPLASFDAFIRGSENELRMHKSFLYELFSRTLISSALGALLFNTENLSE